MNKPNCRVIMHSLLTSRGQVPSQKGRSEQWELRSGKIILSVKLKRVWKLIDSTLSKSYQSVGKGWLNSPRRLKGVYGAHAKRGSGAKE